MKNNKLYIIWDTKNNEQQIMKSKKKFFMNKGAAKNSLMNHLWSNEDDLKPSDIIDKKDVIIYPKWNPKRIYLDKFNNQTRYECWECDFVKNKKV